MNIKQVETAFLALVVFFTIFSSIQAAEPLPDTGQTKFYNNSIEIIEPAPENDFYGQDAHYIRERSYTKLTANSSELPDSATTWYMVRDNVTELVWEVKNSKDGIKNYDNPHDADNIYTWYDSNPNTNGGYAGNVGSYNTDTESFIEAMNAGFGYCNHSDWRLPTVKELTRLTDSNSHNPSLDKTFFPAVISFSYWSSTSYAGYNHHAWYIEFDHGNVEGRYKYYSFHARAVRSAN